MTSFRKLALASLIVTFFLVSVGGLVRATKSGLGCGTDWPHCHGELIPAFTSSEVVIEYTHRVVAAFVGLMMIALVVLAVRHFRANRPVLWASVAALGLVVFQGILGMVVVRRELEAESVVAHLTTAMILFAVLVYLVLATYRPEPVTPRDRSLSRRSAFAAGTVLVLLIVGSYTTGRDAGYVFSDWPLMGGRVIPDLAIELHAIHFLHRALAVIVGAIVLVVSLGVIRRAAEMPLQARLAHVAVGLYAVQIAVGALNVWTWFSASTLFNALSVTTHLTLGAAIWGSLVALSLTTSPAMQEATAGYRIGARPAVETGG